MRCLPLALASLVALLIPSGALAAFETPSQLLTSIQNGPARAFTVNAHGSNNGTYISVWTKGRAQGGNAENRMLWATGTVDTVQDGLTMRMKGELIETGTKVYGLLRSLSGTMQSAVLSLAGQQKEWFVLPPEAKYDLLIADGVPLEISGLDATLADSMFAMQTRENGKNTIYMLRMKPDYSPVLAQRIRELLDDTSPVSNDFLPWRQLAEGTKYELVITMDRSSFVSSSLTMNMKIRNSSFTAQSSEQAAPTTVMSVPVNAEDAPAIIRALLPVRPMTTIPAPEWMPMPDQSMLDRMMMESPSTLILNCSDPEITPQALLSLERTGECPVVKVSTRYSEWK